jgi:hypothetical protein
MPGILKNPKHGSYEETHEWAGDFAPEYINIEEMNDMLEKIFKPAPKSRQRMPHSSQIIP